MWCVGGKAVLGWRPLECSPARGIGVVSASSSRHWHRRYGGFEGTTAPWFAEAVGGFSCFDWVAAQGQHGGVCGALRAGKGDDHNDGSEPQPELLHLIPEIHGRRTRAGRPRPQGPYNNIMLQGFNWESHKETSNGKRWWQVLKDQVEELCSVGITDIWLPPVSQSVDRQGYLPSELYNLDASKYGTGIQLKELIDDLHLHGICIIADIVINHRSGGLQDNKGHWNVFKGGNRDKRLDWGPWAVVDDDVYDSGGKGHHDTGESYAAAPDLDHTNKQVQDELTDWMNWLKAEIGFDGWRFDFVKGYAPTYTKLYCSRTSPTFAVGELWTSMAYFDGQLSWDQNGHRQALCNWIDGTDGASCAFDFTTKGILQRAVENELWRLKDSQGKPPGLMGWWPEKSVTFLDNHDTGSTQRHWAFPDKRVLQGYAYTLTHPGIPCIFYDHLYEFKLMAKIKELVELRKRHCINAISKVIIQKAEGDIYVAKIDNRVIVKLGTRYDMGSLAPGKDSWNLTLTGPDYAIWETTAPLTPPSVPAVPAEDIDESKIELLRPKQPIHITSKMSKETRNRIFTEVPEFVDAEDSAKHSNRSEQDHVHKKDKVETALSGVTTSRGKGRKETAVGAHAKNKDGTNKRQQQPAEVPTPKGKADAKPETAAPGDIAMVHEGDRTQYKATLPKVATQIEAEIAAPAQVMATTEGDGTDKRPSAEQHHKRVNVRPEVHGRRTRPGRPTPHGPHGNIIFQNDAVLHPDLTLLPSSIQELVKHPHKFPVVFYVTPQVIIIFTPRPLFLSVTLKLLVAPHTGGSLYWALCHAENKQGFNWESHNMAKYGQSWWAFLRTRVEEFAALGITDIWLPPPSHSVDKNGYLPSELYNLDASNYGTGTELKELIDELHLHGISVIADIVINHRCGGLQDSRGRWNVFKGGNLDKRLDWGPWAVVDDDVYDSGGKGTHDTGEAYAAAPDLDHTNKQVQDELTDWMNWLKAEIGFDGWRFDFVKGYDPKFTNIYCTRTNPTISVGELWTSMAYDNGEMAFDQNMHRQNLCNWIDGTKGASCVFDFTTKGILQHAVENELWRLKDSKGKPPGLIGWYPQNAVTFIDNHDTGSTQRHWAFPDRKVEMGYAYILTHPGIPCIFMDHVYEFKLMDQIQKLVTIRTNNHINSMSAVVIQKAEATIYVAKIDDRVILKLGSRVDMDDLLPEKSKWEIVLSGAEYCIWESTDPFPSLPLEELESEQQNGGLSKSVAPTQPVRITTKMSEATRKRILEEVPELVREDNQNHDQKPIPMHYPDDGKKKKKKPTRSKPK